MFQGRRTLDELNRTLLITGFACALVGTLFFQYGTWPRYVVSGTAAACIVFAAIRLLGGRPEKRSQENLRFLTAVTAAREGLERLTGRFRGGRAGGAGRQTTHRARKARKNPTWAEIRQYKYFICPQCTQRLRVPRGKGKLRVTCTKCGNVFETKS